MRFDPRLPQDPSARCLLFFQQRRMRGVGSNRRPF